MFPGSKKPADDDDKNPTITNTNDLANSLFARVAEEKMKNKDNCDIFYPTIFRYKCRGAFFATSDRPGSNGICKGIKTDFKPLYAFDKRSLKESINVFNNIASNDGDYTDNDNNNNEVYSNVISNTNTDEMDDHNQYFPPAMIYDFSKKDKMKSHAERFEENARKGYHLRKLAEIGDSHKGLKEFHEKKVAELRKKTLRKHQKLLSDSKEEHVLEVAQENKNNNKDEDWQDWYAYGSTDVYLLVLRDVKNQNKERTMGIAPNCNVGLTFRDVGTNTKDGVTKNNKSEAGLRLGPVEIIFGSTNSDEDEVSNKTRTSFSQRKQQMITDHENNKKNNPEEKDRLITTTNVLAGASKVLAQSQKILNAMKSNAIMLREAVREDFPRRVFYSGQRILTQFPKTIDKTGKAMYGFYQYFSPNSRNNDDND
eukprot:CAMPEP_0194169164 /NCGR_PEP_ID=MMETSP0154-20130528/3826_1 /TAXON_ID=1049557 /ORGANISM="Thalassiothrix antarctica, Strain L6-D1" /LENGTH=424 /DNA_ID=CAMNT_0038880415 /DNA_START=116 /DNA_END=1387 /DNA_ORIENTATION=-